MFDMTANAQSHRNDEIIIQFVKWWAIITLSSGLVAGLVTWDWVTGLNVLMAVFFLIPTAVGMEMIFYFLAFCFLMFFLDWIWIAAPLAIVALGALAYSDTEAAYLIGGLVLGAVSACCRQLYYFLEGKVTAIRQKRAS